MYTLGDPAVEPQNRPWVSLLERPPGVIPQGGNGGIQPLPENARKGVVKRRPGQH